MFDQGMNPEIAKMMRDMQNQMHEKKGKHSAIKSERKATKTPESKICAKTREKNKQIKKQKQKERRMHKK